MGSLSSPAFTDAATHLERAEDQITDLGKAVEPTTLLLASIANSLLVICQQLNKIAEGA